MDESKEENNPNAKFEMAMKGKRVDWKATKANLEAYYKAQRGYWRESEIVMAIVDLPKRMKELKVRYYKIRHSLKSK